MPKGDASSFLKFLNEQNERIVARLAEEKAQKPGEDPVRLQRDQERREKWGTLRAREHPGRRPHRVHSLFGYMNMNE